MTGGGNGGIVLWRCGLCGVIGHRSEAHEHASTAPLAPNAPVCLPTPHRCPVCDGQGVVLPGFYGGVGRFTSGSTIALEQCRSCLGTGIVWSPA